MCTELLLIAILLLSVSCYQSISAGLNSLSRKPLKKAVNSSQLNLLNGPASLSIQPTAEQLPGCTTIGQYEEPHPTVRAAWSTFKLHMDNYIDFHHHQLQKLKSGDSSIRTLTWSCYNPVECCGIGDQLYIIQQALVYAIISNMVLSLHWNPVSYETMKYLTPNKIDWTYFNRSQGMKDRHSREQYRVSMKQYLLISYSYYVCRVIIELAWSNLYFE